jgi:2-haloacid dehalogenase/putative hydrolase of the HAD superfamily
MPRFDFVTFDCYGTLIDWDRGITAAFAREAERRGVRADPAAVLEAYHAVEPEVEAGEYRRYREVLARAAERVAERLGWPSGGSGAFLAESLSSWPAFSDTNPALERLSSAGVRLGILSNVDEDLLARTLSRLTAPFELVVTAERVRSYKPGRAHFEEARRRIPAERRWLHAAQSYFHDVVPARAMGIPVAWINRKGESAGAAGAPDEEYRDLEALAAAF